MKRRNLLIAFLLSYFCFSVAAADNTERYRNSIDKARKYEEKGYYVYALNYYWNAMEIGFPIYGNEAYEAFHNLAKRIENGNPFYYDLKNEENDPFEFYDSWKQQKELFCKFYTANSPYIYELKEPKKIATDYNKKTTDWSIPIVTSLVPRYTVIEEIFNKGYKNALSLGLKSLSWCSLSDIPQCKITEFEIQDSAGNTVCSATDITNDNIVFKRVDREGTNKIRYEEIKYRIEAKNLDQKRQIRFSNKSYKPNVNICEFYNNLNFTYFEKTKNTYPYYLQNEELSKNLFYYVMNSYLEKTKLSESEILNNYGLIIFCNLLSEMANRTPCYSYNGSTNVYDWPIPTQEFIQNNKDFLFDSDSLNDGYRFPYLKEENDIYYNSRNHGTWNKIYAEYSYMDVKLIHTVERAVLQVYLDEENRLKAEEQARIEEKNRLEEEARLARLEEKARLAKIEEKKRIEEEKQREKEMQEYLKKNKKQESISWFLNSSYRITAPNLFVYNLNLNDGYSNIGMTVGAVGPLTPLFYYYGNVGGEKAEKIIDGFPFYTDFGLGVCLPIIKNIKSYCSFGFYYHDMNIGNDTNEPDDESGVILSFGLDMVLPIEDEAGLAITAEYGLLYKEMKKLSGNKLSFGIGINIMMDNVW